MTIYNGPIEGDLILMKGDDASKVTSVGGNVDAWENAQLDLSACTSVGGHDLPDTETARARLIEVAKHALATPGALNMRSWHNESCGCGSTHCIAGWAVHLEGEQGYALEREVKQPTAGYILLGLEASRLFFLDNDKARSELHKVLADAGEVIPPSEGAVQ